MLKRILIRTLGLCFLVQVCLFLSPDYIDADTERFKATRDVWVSSFPGEENRNMGATRKLKLKGIQEMAILDFDLSSLKGKKVEKARLFIYNASDKNMLRKIGISTVSSPWIEGKSRGFIPDMLGRGATFNYSSYKKRKWAGPDSDLTDVSMGTGNTWHHHTELRQEEGMWWSVDLNPDLIYALITGKSYGLLVMDESGQTFANNYVYSRESGEHSPYIEIEFSDIHKKRPDRLTVGIRRSPEYAHMRSGAVLLYVEVGEEIFAYNIHIDDEKLPLWKVPIPERIGAIQEIVLDRLPPEKEVEVRITADDHYGQTSDPAVLKTVTSKALERIRIPARSSGKIKRDLKASSEKSSSFNVWAMPELTGIDPVSDTVYSEHVIDREMKRSNPIWSAVDHKINLVGIRGEVITFQLSVSGNIDEIKDIGIEIKPLINKGGRQIGPERFDFFQVRYLNVKERWYPEIAVPMNNGKINIKGLNQNISNQKNQLIFVELSVPYESASGIYNSEIIVKIGGRSESIPVSLKVYDRTIPKKLSFIPELNMYKGPGSAGSEKFYEAHRIAHDHRTVINRVPYSQDGKVHKDMVPEISYDRDGNPVIDWSDYDRNLGPLFDGSAFRSGDRKGLPVERFYLPIFESWPTPLESDYDYKSIKNKSQKDIINHALHVKPLDKALGYRYKKNYARIVKEFKRHFEEKGWAGTEFQFYLNNKWHWKETSSWWNLDEPMSYDDWMALRYFGILFKGALGDRPSNFIFRADISRPWWQHDRLDGILDRMYVQDKAYLYRTERVRAMKNEKKIGLSVYGSLNEVGSPNYQTTLWCMRAYVDGAEGVLPWQSLGGAKAFNVADRNALIIDAGDTLGINWVTSLRVKALRSCQQNVELMRIVEHENGYRREQMRDFYYRYFWLKQEGEGSLDKRAETGSSKIEKFRRSLLNMLKTK